jgi:hypothetical protein
MGCCCSCCSPPATKCTEQSAGQEGFFACDGKCGGGSVWGSGPYTGDSDICSAAQHAGVIGESGGVFKVTNAPGCDSYTGSTANGVTTSGYGSYGSSFNVSKF